MDLMFIKNLPLLLVYPALAIIGLILVAIVVGCFKRLERWPYRKVAIMSPVEKKFYWQLKQVFPQYHVLAQVQLSRIIRPPKGKHEWKWLNKICRMSVDYVLLNAALETVVVIELDDSSHLLPSRQEADQRKNKALKVAGVRLIRIETKHIPTDVQLATLVNTI